LAKFLFYSLHIAIISDRIHVKKTRFAVYVDTLRREGCNSLLSLVMLLIPFNFRKYVLKPFKASFETHSNWFRLPTRNGTSFGAAHLVCIEYFRANVLAHYARCKYFGIAVSNVEQLDRFESIDSNVQSRARRSPTRSATPATERKMDLRQLSL
jgi:hypothetical protein